MIEFYEIEGAGQVRVGTKVERWLGGEPRDWGEVTMLLPAGEVVVSWEGTADTLIHDVGDLIDLCVSDWSDAVCALVASRADEAGAGRLMAGATLEGET